MPNWGTKWDLGSPRLDHTPGALFYQFDSAWSPPTKAFDKIAKDWPTLVFSLQYYEMGCYFAGQFTWEEGEPVDQNEGTPEEFGFCSEALEEMARWNE